MDRPDVRTREGHIQSWHSSPQKTTVSSGSPKSKQDTGFYALS